MVVVCVQSDATPIEFSVRSAPSFLLASDLRLLNLPALQRAHGRFLLASSRASSRQTPIPAE